MERIENRMVVDSEWPDDTPKVLCACDECGDEIYVGTEYFDFDGDIVCEDCASEYVRNRYRRLAENG